MSVFERTKRNRVLRHHERGNYERDQIYAILEEALYCHVAFQIDGQPYIIPTLHARDGDTLLLHGSSASRMLRHAGKHSICVAVTLMDGIVLARSAYHHSINYRSAVLFGQGEYITDPERKLDALERFTERIMPGRWNDARKPDPQELKATGVIAMPIESASAKIRTGSAVDDERDMDLPVWAGVVPVYQAIAPPIPDPNARRDVPMPDYLRAYVEARLRD